MAGPPKSKPTKLQKKGNARPPKAKKNYLAQSKKGPLQGEPGQPPSPEPAPSPDHFTAAELARYRALLKQPAAELRSRIAVSNAPPPPTPLRGGWIPPKPKPTQALTDLPTDYPNTLKPQTWIIIAKAVKKFPVQAQTLELCRYVAFELTPHFRAAVQDRKLRADLALSSMSDLLRYLLGANCKDSSEVFHFEKEMKKSDEWVKLAEELLAVADVQPTPETLPPVARETELPDTETTADTLSQKYDLTEKQRRCVATLLKAKTKGTEFLHQKRILEMADLPNTSRLNDIFRSRPKAWIALIRSKGKGEYGLNPSA